MGLRWPPLPTARSRPKWHESGTKLAPRRSGAVRSGEPIRPIWRASEPRRDRRRRRQRSEPGRRRRLVRHARPTRTARCQPEGRPAAGGDRKGSGPDPARAAETWPSTTSKPTTSPPRSRSSRPRQSRSIAGSATTSATSTAPFWRKDSSSPSWRSTSTSTSTGSDHSRTRRQERTMTEHPNAAVVRSAHEAVEGGRTERTAR